LKERNLSNLFQAQPFPCVSIYMDIGITPSERWSAPSRLRALVREADKALAKVPEVEAKPFLLAPLATHAIDSLRDIPEDSRGVALFRSFQTAGIYPIDHPVGEVVAVSDTFHLKPLLPEIQGRDEYYAIVLSHRLIRLYRGNEHRFALVESYAAPEEARDLQSPQLKSRRERGAPRGKVARYPVSRIPPISRVEEFVRQAETSIRQKLEGRAAPVVLVGSPLLRRFYRMTCAHGQLVAEEVAAMFGIHEQRAIHRSTWPIARQEFSRRSGRVISSYQRLVGTGQASDALEEIAVEALRGRVSELLISKQDQIYGRLDRSTGKVISLQPDQGVGDDVLCDVAQEVMLRGGSALLLSKHEMPTKSSIAAIYRW
jgi:hypothetical protein